MKIFRICEGRVCRKWKNWRHARDKLY